MKTTLRNLALIAVLIAGVFALSAKEKDNHRSETRKFEQTTRAIQASQGVEIEYIIREGAGTSVTLEGPEENVGHMIVKMSGEKLTIRCEDRSTGSSWASKVKATVVTGKIHSYDLNSAAKLECEGNLDLSGKNIKINISSAAKVELNSVNCGAMTIDASSAADVEINSLKANVTDIDASSAAKVEIDDITSQKTSADASSSAKVEFSRGNTGVTKLSASSCGKIRKGKTLASSFSSDTSSLGSVK